MGNIFCNWSNSVKGAVYERGTGFVKRNFERKQILNEQILKKKLLKGIRVCKSRF